MSSERAREFRWTAAWCAVALAFPWSNAFMSVAAGWLGLAAILDFEKTDTAHGRIGGAASRTRPDGVVLLSGLSSLWSEDAAGTERRAHQTAHCWWADWPCSRRGAVPSCRKGSVRRSHTVRHSAHFGQRDVLIVLDLANGAPFGGRPSSRFISHIRLGLWWAVLLPWAVRSLTRSLALLFVGMAFATWFWTESLSGMLCGAADCRMVVACTPFRFEGNVAGRMVCGNPCGGNRWRIADCGARIGSALPDEYPDAAASANVEC